MLRSLVLSSLFLLVNFAAQGQLREAPNKNAKPASQLVVSGNACGPTALLNTFRFANEDWQRALQGISGENDKQRIYTIIREIGMRPSTSFKGRPRWSRKGVNIADLRDMGNEMTLGKYLPKLHEEVFFKTPRESPEKLLKRVHDRLETSLRKGLPPIVSLRRYALRSKSSGAEWVVLEAHFVTLISVPQKLERDARSFAVSYIDPWGGKIHQGSIAISEQSVLAQSGQEAPCLEAIFPQALVGKKLVKPGEKQALTVAAALGRW